MKVGGRRSESSRIRCTGVKIIRNSASTESEMLRSCAASSNIARALLDYTVGRTAVVSGERLTDGVDALQTYLLNPDESRDAPSRGAAHCRLGMMYERLGRVSDARAEYNAAVALEPNNAELRRSLDHLSK